MPRQKSDKTVTHRIELGLPERSELKEIIATQKENQRLDAITNTLQAVGTGLAGGGLIWGAIVLGAWLAPKLLNETKDKIKNTVDKVSADILTPVVDPVVQSIVNDYKSAVDFEQEMKNQVNYFCTPSSIGYDEQKCVIAQNNLDQAKAQREEYQESVRDFQEEIKDISLFDYLNPVGTLLGLANSAPTNKSKLQELIDQYGTAEQYGFGYLVDTNGDGQVDQWLWG